MRSLVTGGAGFIGSNLVDALLARGDDVLVIDDLSTGRRGNLDEASSAGARLEVVDVCEASAVTERFEGFRPELVFHLAAQMDVRKSLADPAFDAAVNLIGTINVLEAARGVGARVVFASTGGAIYGEGEGRDLPFTEEDRCAPEAPYGQSKLAAEGYCALWDRLHGLTVSCLRLGNVYGPRQDPLGEAGVIAIFCNCLNEGRRPTVYGDGLQTRDYVYVADVVAAMVAASGSAATGVFNVGTGTETSVLDIVSAMGRISGAEGFEPEIAPARKGEIQRTSIDSSLAGRELGWRAQTPMFDQGLEWTIAWARRTS